MIELKDIRVVFNRKTPLEHEVLRGLNLSIGDGEFVILIGGNGAGKSTLMNVVAGEVAPTSGSIFIDGEDCTGDSVQRRSGGVSRVFQDPMLGTCADLTVEENLALAFARGRSRGLRGAITKEGRDEFRVRLERLGMGMEGRIGDKMSSLSGGQRQALSLVMATMRPTKVLLLDEHTAALDPKMARKVLDLTLELVHEQGLTALMVTHSMQQALELGTRTVLLKDGVVQEDYDARARRGMNAGDLVALFE